MIGMLVSLMLVTPVPCSVINLKIDVFASLSISFFVCQVDARFYTFRCPRSSSLGVISSFRPFTRSLLLLIHHLKSRCKNFNLSILQVILLPFKLQNPMESSDWFEGRRFYQVFWRSLLSYSFQGPPSWKMSQFQSSHQSRASRR